VGGAIASGLDFAPLRHFRKCARFMIGAEFVDGTARRQKWRGVCQKCDGSDFHKLMTGRCGSLAGDHAREFPAFSDSASRRGFYRVFGMKRERCGFAKPQLRISR